MKATDPERELGMVAGRTEPSVALVQWVGSSPELRLPDTHVRQMIVGAASLIVGNGFPRGLRSIVAS